MIAQFVPDTMLRVLRKPLNSFMRLQCSGTRSDTGTKMFPTRKSHARVVNQKTGAVMVLLHVVPKKASLIAENVRNSLVKDSRNALR